MPFATQNGALLWNAAEDKVRILDGRTLREPTFPGTILRLALTANDNCIIIIRKHRDQGKSSSNTYTGVTRVMLDRDAEGVLLVRPESKPLNLGLQSVSSKDIQLVVSHKPDLQTAWLVTSRGEVREIVST